MSNNLYSKQLSDKTLKSLLLFAAFSVFATFASRAQSYGTMLEPIAVNNSDNFKSRVNQDRDAYYALLAPLILVKPVQAPDSVYSNSIGSKVTTLSEIVYMLGQPDNKLQQNIYEYNLKAALGCKAVIGFNATGEVTFVVTKNCP